MSLNKSALKIIIELEPKYGADLWRYVEYRLEGDPDWYTCIDHNRFDVRDSSAVEYRVKPRTHRINGIECPAPLRVEPDVEVEYYHIDTTGTSKVGSYRWADYDCSIDRHLFKMGNCFATREDALANFYAHYPHMKGE